MIWHAASRYAGGTRRVLQVRDGFPLAGLLSGGGDFGNRVDGNDARAPWPIGPMNRTPSESVVVRIVDGAQSSSTA